MDHILVADGLTVLDEDEDDDNPNPKTSSSSKVSLADASFYVHPGLCRVIFRQNVPGTSASKLMQSISALMFTSNGCQEGHDASSLLSH